MRINPAVSGIFGTPPPASSGSGADFAALLGGDAGAVDRALKPTARDPQGVGVSPVVGDPPRTGASPHKTLTTDTDAHAVAGVGPRVQIEAAVPGAVADPGPVVPPDPIVGRAGAMLPAAYAPRQDDAAPAAADLIMQPSSAQRDQERAQGAFGFGVFGLFPPGYAAGEGRIAVAEPGWAPTGVADTSDETTTGFAPMTGAPAADAAVSADIADDGDVAAGGLVAAPPRSPDAAEGDLADLAIEDAMSPDFDGDPSAPTTDGAAPQTSRLPTPRRPAPTVSLVLSGVDDRLAVVAAAPLNSIDHADVRARLKAVAANLGAALDDVQINGLGGAAPPSAGGRHGARTR